VTCGVKRLNYHAAMPFGVSELLRLGLGLGAIAAVTLAYVQWLHVSNAATRWELLWRGSTLDTFLSAVPDAAVQVVPLNDG
jgi:hypothetical protein